MSISLLLEMSASAEPDRMAVVSVEDRLTAGELSALVDGRAGVVSRMRAQTVVSTAGNSGYFPGCDCVDHAPLTVSCSSADYPPPQPERSCGG